MGVIALLVGVLAVLAAFGFDTAPTGTHNLGRLQEQMMILHTGLALLIVSAIRWDAGNTKRAAVPTEVTDPDGDGEAESKARKVRETHIALGGVFVVVIILVVAFAGNR